MTKRTSATTKATPIPYHGIYQVFHFGQNNGPATGGFLIAFLNEDARKRFLRTEGTNIKKLGKVNETATHGVHDDDYSTLATASLPAIEIDIPLKNDDLDEKFKSKIKLYLDNLKKDKKIVYVPRKDVIDENLRREGKVISLKRSLMRKLFTGLAISFVCVIGLGFLNLNPLFMSMASIATIVGLTYQPLAKLFFGQKNIELEKKNGKLVAMDAMDAIELKGLSYYLGIEKPYQHDLSTLEKEIDSLLTQEGTIKDSKRIQVLTHQYAKKVVQANPSFFSEQDKAVVKRYALR